MKKTRYLLIGIALLGVIFSTKLMPANAAPEFQPTPFPTPTPGADGRILYTVQSGDTLWRVAAVSGVPLEELRQLNNMSADDVLIVGQVLLLGLAGPAEAPPPAPGDTQQPVDPAVTPGPTQIIESGEVCVLLYADRNGDALRQDDEMAILGGEVSVTERLGTYSDKKPTIAGDPAVDDVLTCFENAPPGSYNVTMAIPEGWNETTVLTKTIELAPGDTSFLNFGAQLSGAQAAEEGSSGTDGDGGGRSPLLGILGILVLLGGAGLGVFAILSGRQRRTSLGEE